MEVEQTEAGKDSKIVFYFTKPVKRACHAAVATALSGIVAGRAFPWKDQPQMLVFNIKNPPLKLEAMGDILCALHDLTVDGERVISRAQLAGALKSFNIETAVRKDPHAFSPKLAALAKG